MTSSRIPSGSVIWYPYLWRWQAARGETEGRKSRPCCMVYEFMDSAGLRHLYLLAISSQPPQGNQKAISIPELERRRAGLEDWREAWITVSEYNHDVAETSFYYEPNAQPIGRFSDRFTRTVAAEFLANVKQLGTAARVNRTE